jgi:MPBQ/MSBQ methyltransferase
MRLIQHKREAYWFYSFLSQFYDRQVNPFFWTESMRARALALAQLNRRDLSVLDVGSGTGFTTEGILRAIDPAHVTCLDQSPHQMSKALHKLSLRGCSFQLGDAEELPFETDAYDRYISAGSIEYWPEPQRGIAEAYRVLKPQGIATVIGPLRPENRVARSLADLWMLFPEEQDYHRWFADAGFTQIETIYLSPEWHGGEKYGLAISGLKSKGGKSPLKLGPKKEDVSEPVPPADRLQLAARLLAGSAAGFAFLPIAVAKTAQLRLGRVLKAARPS